MAGGGGGLRPDPHFRELPGDYLFSEVARRAAAYQREHPDVRLLHLGVGDVKGPLAPAVVEAMAAAVAELGRAETFRGYGPEQGYLFLREAMAREDFQARGAEIGPEEICVSDGAKSDCGDIGDLFAPESRVAVCDPVYPAYVDAAVLAGRAGTYDPATGRWSGLVYLPCRPEDGFMPRPPEEPVDLVWLCSPNNPTGGAATRGQLQAWVDYANDCGAVLLFDAAYEAFLDGTDRPRSIFEVPGARRCAIEFRSFSKTAGFTGVRCGAVAIPSELVREGQSLLSLWRRRQSVRYNGNSYIAQRGAAAAYTPEGRRQVRANVAACRRAARLLLEGAEAVGLTAYGGTCAPYVWARVPAGMTSWSFFDLLLREAGVVATPGSGFGPGGEGYIRFSVFGGEETVRAAVERLRRL